MKTMLTMVAVGAASSVALGQVNKTGTTTTAIHIAGPTLASADNYGSGNDDSFAEYGMTTFNFDNSDFGFAVTDIVGVELCLTVNDRTFSDGDMVEIFFTPDTAADLGGGFASLSYNSGLTNGIDGSQYLTAPESLGVFAIPEMAGRAGGEVDNLNLTLSATATANLVASINAGSDFQIIVAATESSHDLTYSGVGNTFDPGDPELKIRAVPAPGGVAVLALGGLLATRRRR